MSLWILIPILILLQMYWYIFVAMHAGLLYKGELGVRSVGFPLLLFCLNIYVNYIEKQCDGKKSKECNLKWIRTVEGLVVLSIVYIIFLIYHVYQLLFT